MPWPRVARSARRRLLGPEAVEGVGDLAGPAPGLVDAESGLSSRAGDPGGDVQDTVAEGRDLAAGEFGGVGEADRLGPGDQIDGGEHDFEPGPRSRPSRGRAGSATRWLWLRGSGPQRGRVDGAATPVRRPGRGSDRVGVGRPVCAGRPPAPSSPAICGRVRSRRLIVRPACSRTTSHWDGAHSSVLITRRKMAHSSLPRARPSDRGAETTARDGRAGALAVALHGHRPCRPDLCSWVDPRLQVRP